MGYSTERYVRKKSSTKKQEERAERLNRRTIGKIKKSNRKNNGIDKLNRMN